MLRVGGRIIGCVSGVLIRVKCCMSRILIRVESGVVRIEAGMR